MERRLFSFRGGVELTAHKQESTDTPVVPARLPPELVIPLHQHIGAPAEPLVQVGERVLKGQMIAKADGYISAPLHASSSGWVTAIEDRPVAHPSGLHAPCIVIKTDGREEWRWRQDHGRDYTTMDPSALRNLIRDAGIVGLGGAGFPSAVKLNPGPGHVVETLILNGAECEPYITCDDMLMRERARDVVLGLQVMRHALQARDCLIGVENNKPEAAKAMRRAVAEADDPGIEVVEVPTVYPAGGEKQLIHTLTGKEVPSNGLPIQVGVVCHNVGTAAAVYRAVYLGEPLISRYMTVAGGVAKARNLEVLIGTPITDIIDQCHGVHATIDKLIVGGPMMGFALHTDHAPVVKTTNCLLISTVADIPLPSRQYAMPCIRCGKCAEVCPVYLLPQQLYWYAKAKDFDKTQDYNLFDCIECGCCDYVCPSHIPLVQYYRFAKTEIWAQEREKKKADLARQRYEFRQERLEREKRERAERHKRKKQALKNEPEGEPKKVEDPKKAAILAAMERAKQKKEASGVQPKNVDNLTEQQQREIAKAESRRARRREQDSGGSDPQQE